MAQRIKVADLELTRPIQSIDGLSCYSFAQLLVRWNGEPIGFIKVPIHNDSCRASDIRKKIIQDLSPQLLQTITRAGLRNIDSLSNGSVRELFFNEPAPCEIDLPSVSVAVCTRNRAKDLAACLSALAQLKLPPTEILVIDNAPENDATRDLVGNFFPAVRYIVEPRPGLDWARNRAIVEARGEILAYTDDDVTVDPLWTEKIAELFAEHSDIMAVTGLVVPLELETESQILFEEYGGFGRGFDRKWYRASRAERSHVAGDFIGAGKFGTGANMAFRRSVFSEIGGFDPALDVGTVTQGGGDLDMFFRVLKHGHTLVYEPAALVRHKHRRSMEKLHMQIVSNGIGFFSHAVRNAIVFPEERGGIVKFALWWIWFWGIRRALRSLFKPHIVPKKFIFGELRGFFIGLFRYQKARATADTFTTRFGLFPFPAKNESASQPPLKTLRYGTAVRSIDLESPLRPIDDVTEYFQTRIFVTRNGAAIGEIEIPNRYRPISVARLSDELAANLHCQILQHDDADSAELQWSSDIAELKNCLVEALSIEELATTKPASVSIVVATCDRPDDLHRCVASLQRQRTKRHVEIIVVDNRPDSGKTPPVVAAFRRVRLIREKRPGLSYARNAGFAASKNELVVCTDDDVIAPVDWLEKILAPFSRNDVMLVTGNVFPAELESSSQLQFENYGGLGRGFERREFNREWFDSFRRKAVPTWEIGATANAAMRAKIFRDPNIGLLDEALGAGMPTGCSEDTYLFYKILLARHTIVYEPSAFVWHQHRATEHELRRQIFSYSKGHVAYHLTTFLRDRDARGLVRVLAELPRHHLRQLWEFVGGNCERSFPTLVLEVAGNLLGGWALWQARERVRKLGRSAPCSSTHKAPKTVRIPILRRPRHQPIFKTVEVK
jgi:GT2 family glycosyltransferase